MSRARSIAPLTMLALSAALLSLSACDKDGDATVHADDAAPTTTATADASTDAAPTFPDIDAVLAGDHRSDDHKARDSSRHPKETLAFFGIERNMKVAELWPGGGWYTEILGAYLRDEGTYVVTNWPTEHERYGEWATKYAEKLAANPEVYGTPTVVTSPIDPAETFELAPEGSLDAVLTFRNSHGWYNNGQTAQVYSAAFRALKPGGVFGVVQHRAAEGGDAEKTSEKGYLPQAQVVEAAQAVGFELVESSELNANANDTKDYEGGVWTLLPNSRGEGDEAQQAAWAAIGESDRMTLKFRKPE